MSRILGFMLALALCAGCGSKSPTQPTTPPSTSPPATSGEPVVRLQVKADGGAPRDAIASMSEIVVDASGSTGSGALTFIVDFGDGTVATSATARHTYGDAGTFTIGVTVTDAQGRKGSATSPVTIKAVNGRWFQAEYVTRSQRVEVRQLSIDAQDGLAVRGVYRVTGDADRSFVGTLTPPRKIQIAIPGGEGLLGLLPDRLSDDVGAWVLIAQGGSVDGERLEFRAVIDSTDAPPKADLRISFDGVFGEPIPSVTTVLFDATSSRGAGLTYSIEFGDGAVSRDALATRVLEGTSGVLTARLTVVDRVGRSDTTSRQVYLFDLVGHGSEPYWVSHDPTDRSIFAVDFHNRNGRSYQGGNWGCESPPVPCSSFGVVSATATLSAARDIVIAVPDRGLTFRGTIERDGTLLLVDQSGKRWTLSYREVY